MRSAKHRRSIRSADPGGGGRGTRGRSMIERPSPVSTPPSPRTGILAPANKYRHTRCVGHRNRQAPGLDVVCCKMNTAVKAPLRTSPAPSAVPSRYNTPHAQAGEYAPPGRAPKPMSRAEGVADDDRGRRTEAEGSCHACRAPDTSTKGGVRGAGRAWAVRLKSEDMRSSGRPEVGSSTAPDAGERDVGRGGAGDRRTGRRHQGRCEGHVVVEKERMREVGEKVGTPSRG